MEEKWFAGALWRDWRWFLICGGKTPVKARNTQALKFHKVLMLSPCPTTAGLGYFCVFDQRGALILSELPASHPHSWFTQQRGPAHNKTTVNSWGTWKHHWQHHFWGRREKKGYTLLPTNIVQSNKDFKNENEESLSGLGIILLKKEHKGSVNHICWWLGRWLLYCQPPAFFEACIQQYSPV